MNFSIVTRRHFKVEHCYGCAVPGYLIVSPRVPVSALGELPHNALEELGPVLAMATEAIQSVVAPIRIYCAQFGEAGDGLHFHVFPRTAEITDAFLADFPAQRAMIHGPVLLDWARSRYRAARSDVWRIIAPTCLALKEKFTPTPTDET